MNPPPLLVYYDFVDPLSFLLGEELAALAPEGDPGGSGSGPAIEWVPFELRPPPTPLVALDDASLAGRWDEARARAGPRSAGRAFAPPSLVPWSRKAHELVLQSAESGAAPAVREGLFEAYLFEGKDIGRVDVLVEVAVAAGLDRTGTKAALDVDRWEADVVTIRADALESGVRTTPVLALGDRRLEGFHNRAAIRTFLGTRTPE